MTLYRDSLCTFSSFPFLPGAVRWAAIFEKCSHVTAC